MKFKVGDRVKLKDDLFDNEEYDGIWFSDDLYRFSPTTIEKVKEDHYMTVDGYAVNDEMIEPAEEQTKYKENIIKLMDKQMNKGLSKYGELLEDNTTLSTGQRIEHLQEELIDGLQYCEHLKVISDKLTANDYQRMALRTKANFDKKEQLIDGGLGIAGEAGEVADIIKKHRFQGHTLDEKHLKEELGDVLWYIAIISDAIGTTLEEVMQFNIDKLKARYPEGFSKERSINRVIGAGTNVGSKTELEEKVEKLNQLGYVYFEAENGPFFKAEDVLKIFEGEGEE